MQGLEQPTAADRHRSAQRAATCALAAADALVPRAPRYSWHRLLQMVGAAGGPPPSDPRAGSTSLASVRRLLRRAADLLLWVK